jgi:2-oxoisovalerate dehydrogenase E2 component (dihydrolipoyl transacylase)
MGIYIIKTPDIGEGIAEVELVAWHVQVGDGVTMDQVLADVMTDKATVEIPSPVAGRILSLSGAIGQTVAVGGELIRLEVAGAGNVKEGAVIAPVAASSAVPQQPTSSVIASPPKPAVNIGAVIASEARQSMTAVPHTESVIAKHEVAAATRRVAPRNDDLGAPSSTSRVPGERAIASPAVRRRAWELGVDLEQVTGAGSGGRVMHADLEAFAKAHPSAPRAAVAPTTPARPPVGVELNTQEVIPVIGLRRRIALKMQDAKRRIPHFTYVEEVDVTELETLRERLNAQWGKERGRLTVLPFLARAMVLALREFPQVNARFDDDVGVVTRFGAVHLGVATQTDNGLMVPVLRHAEARDLWSCAAEISRLAEVARSGKATREELSGSTITLTSLGALGGIVSTPVINHPEVAIVGVNRMVARPVVLRGAVVVRQMMNLSSSFDHRVVDGLDAARFIQALRGYLEVPATLFVEA